MVSRQAELGPNLYVDGLGTPAQTKPRLRSLKQEPKTGIRRVSDEVWQHELRVLDERAGGRTILLGLSGDRGLPVLSAAGSTYSARTETPAPLADKQLIAAPRAVVLGKKWIG